MKKIFIHFTAIATAICLPLAQTYAGGCHLKNVTPSKMLVSRHLANLIRDKVIEVEKEMNRRGQTMNAVFVARSGESLDNFDIIPENNKLGLQEYMNTLAKISIANKRGQLTDERGRKIPASKTTKLPEEYYLKEKMQYSHLGLLIKNNKVIDSSKETVNDWIYIVDLLAECDMCSNRYGQSDVFYHVLEQFFWDTKILDKKQNRNKAIFIVPKPELQERLFELVHNKTIGTGNLHQPKYNVAATPFTLQSFKKIKKPAPDYHQLKDQNSNQWPLELLVAATKPVGEVATRWQAQDLLMQTNYHPTLVRPTGFKESNACALKKGPFWDATNLLNCDDQVFRNYGILQLITVRSVTNYMMKENLLAENVYDANQPAIYEVQASDADLERLDKNGKVIEEIDELLNPKDPKEKPDKIDRKKLKCEKSDANSFSEL